jgi:hypothetical protein
MNNLELRAEIERIKVLNVSKKTVKISGLHEYNAAEGAQHTIMMSSIKTTNHDSENRDTFTDIGTVT